MAYALARMLQQVRITALYITNSNGISLPVPILYSLVKYYYDIILYDEIQRTCTSS